MSSQSKKEWQAPTVDVLDVSLTMHGNGGTLIDKNRINAKHPDDAPLPTDS